MTQVRFNITIPDDLKARMKEVREDVNWSTVAAHAFEQKLAEILKRKGPKDMKSAIERLRASKQRLDNEEYEAGFEAGQNWAMESAEAWELTNIAEWKGSFQIGERGGKWEDNDYRLALNSPCIDAGDDQQVPADLSDIDDDGNKAEIGHTGDFDHFLHDLAGE